MFHEARNPQDFIYEAIYTEYVRAHLKKLFTQNGKAYTVWSNSYYESGYVNTGHYWYLGEKNKFSYKNEDLHFDPESFSHMKNRVLFDTKIGHEEHSFAFNVITQLAPDLEWNLLE